MCSVTKELPWGAVAEGCSVWLSGERFAFSWEEWIKCPRFRAEASRGWLLVWRNIRQNCCLPCLSQPQGLEKPLWSLKLLPYTGSVSWVFPVLSPGRMICVFLSCLCFGMECWDFWRTVPEIHCLRLTTNYDHKLNPVNLPDIDSPLLLQLLLKSWSFSIFSFQAK